MSWRRACEIESFIVKNNQFINNVSLIRGAGSTTQDPTVTPYGFEYFEYTNNSVYNCSVSHIVIQNFPTYKSEVANNIIRNFMYVFYNNGVTNGGTNEAQQMAVGLLNVHNNTVTCDDDYILTSSSGSYYAFVLVENNTVNYLNNHVEGLKSTVSGGTMALYDAYLSSINVVSSGNTYKNNAIFNATTTNNFLIKCKKDSTVGLPTRKTITNNTYVIEDTWVSRMGKTAADIKHKLYSIQSDTNAGKVVIKGNTFRLQTIDGNTNQTVEDFVFQDNYIYCKEVASTGKNMVSVNAFDATATLTIKGNTFIIDGVGAPTLLYDKDSSTYTFARIVLDGNYLEQKQNTSDYIIGIQYAKCTNLIMTNNTVRGNIYYWNYDNHYKDAYADNNHLIGNSTSGKSVLRLQTFYGKGSYKEAGFGLIANTYLSIHTDATLTSAAKTYYTYRVKFEDKSGWNQIEFAYELDYATGVYTLVWVDDAAAPRSDVLITTTDGNGVYTAKTLTGTGTLTLSAKLVNGATGAYFRIYGFPAVPCRYEVEVHSFEE